MGNYYTPFSVRVDDQLLAKLKIIAAYYGRPVNKEIEALIIRRIAEWEKERGEITFPEDKG